MNCCRVFSVVVLIVGGMFFISCGDSSDANAPKAANALTASKDSAAVQWRGPGRDGVFRDQGLLQEWPEEGPLIVWQAKNLGRGYSSIAIAQGRIYTMGQRRRIEQLICLSADDGRELWSLDVGRGDHCNCTPTVDRRLVFALGLKGDLVCADAQTGKEIWRKNYARDFGGKMMSGWGYSESPLVDGNRLICTPGGAKAMLACLDKRTGRTLWTSSMPRGGDRGRDGAGYSSVVISHATGVKQYVQLVGRGLIGVSAVDGKQLWHYPRIANGTANIPTPLVRGDYVFCSSGYGEGGTALLKIVNRSGRIGYEEVYYHRSRELQNHHGGMVLLGDYVYMGHGHNRGFPVCVEFMTGRRIWGPERGPGGGSAATAYADGRLYFRYQDAVMALIEATPKGYSIKGKFRIASRNGESWPHPIIADKRLYLRDQHQLHCYDLTRK